MKKVKGVIGAINWTKVNMILFSVFSFMTGLITIMNYTISGDKNWLWLLVMVVLSTVLYLTLTAKKEKKTQAKELSQENKVVEIKGDNIQWS